MKSSVTKPTLIIDKAKVENNINRLTRKASRDGVIFRPHFKTHQSVIIGEFFRKKGIDRITVSSVSMAKYFAADGWNDITIAFPVNLREIEDINNLADQLNLNLLTDSDFSSRQLANALNHKAGVFIEIDNGYQRSGLPADRINETDKIVETLDQSRNLEFRGFLTHAGNTYNARGRDSIIAIMDDAATKLEVLKQRYLSDFPDIITSYGDTPSCSIADDLSIFDEIRPGNFVYYDVMQYHIGACSLSDIAVAVGCPVVSVYPERNELIIYGGAVHLSKESIEGDNRFKLFGYIVELKENGWGEPLPGAYVSSISQEHGIVSMPENYMNGFKPGDILGVLPIHSCLTANLLQGQSVLV